MNKLSLFLITLSVVMLSGCKKKVIILDETTEPVQLYDYYVDEFGNEGVVFYENDNDYSSLAIVVSATESELSWGPMGERVFVRDTVRNKDLDDKTYSLAILQEMFRKGIDRYPAQKWCNEMNHGRIPYSGSWRLPSQYEWERICSMLKGVNTALCDIGAVPLDESFHYWTATEDFLWNFSTEEAQDNDPYNRAVLMTPKETAYLNKDLWIKEMKYHVRAIKYILYAD